MARTHVIICHRTGSEQNPYVVINISMSAWLHGHTTHPALNGHNDILLKTGARPGEKLPKSACGTPVRPNPPKEDDPKKPTDPAPVTPATTTTTPAPTDVAGDPPSTTGTQGANHAGSLGKAVVTGELPFTGVPLWIAALCGCLLLGSGAALRRRFRNLNPESVQVEGSHSARNARTTSK